MIADPPEVGNDFSSAVNCFLFGLHGAEAKMLNPNFLNRRCSVFTTCSVAVVSETKYTPCCSIKSTNHLVLFKGLPHLPP